MSKLRCDRDDINSRRFGGTESVRAGRNRRSRGTNIVEDHDSTSSAYMNIPDQCKSSTDILPSFISRHIHLRRGRTHAV